MGGQAVSRGSALAHLLSYNCCNSDGLVKEEKREFTIMQTCPKYEYKRDGRLPNDMKINGTQEQLSHFMFNSKIHNKAYNIMCTRILHKKAT